MEIFWNKHFLLSVVVMAHNELKLWAGVMKQRPSLDTMGIMIYS